MFRGIFMSQIALVIMAAGMGSRFGGLKQLQGIDHLGHKMVDFSAFDGVRAGFDKLVFIIRRQIEELFLAEIMPVISRMNIDVECVFQDVGALPVGRSKPYGTAHAVVCLKGRVNSPFALINADDFYGSDAFDKMYSFLSEKRSDGDYAMVGYRLKNTISKNGAVSRGICSVENGYLSEIKEQGNIVKRDDNIVVDGTDCRYLDPNTIVSVNMWGFGEDIIDRCQEYFDRFIKNDLPLDPINREIFLPSVVDGLIKDGYARVRVLYSEDSWYGITYKEDIFDVRKALSSPEMKEKYRFN